MIQYRRPPRAASLHQLHRQLSQYLAAGHEVDALETAAGANPADSELAGQLLSITRQLFPPGPLGVNWQTDPDDENLNYLLITVAAEGEFPAIREKQSRWHEEVESLVGHEANNIRLSVYPR